MIVKPSKSSDKTVHFNVKEGEEDEVKLKGKRSRGRRSSSVDSTDEENLEKVPWKELLKLNIPDWYLVIPGSKLIGGWDRVCVAIRHYNFILLIFFLGIIFSAIQGSMFPLMAIIFSSLLEVTILLHVSLLHNKIFKICIHILAILHILHILHFSSIRYSVAPIEMSC